MPRIIHIGVGNFHRAHQAVYTADASDGWNVTGVVMGNAALFEAMDGGVGYDLAIRGPSGVRHKNINIHDKMIFARQAPGTVIDAFVDPDVHIVTLTITEKGYCLDAATGALDLKNPSILKDLTGDPTGAIGLLANGLARRKSAGLPPLTVISCDNLSGNGGKLQGAVTAFSQAASLLQDPKTCFPDTMVDRITPAIPDEKAPVVTEEFSEWVIEGNFAGPRPNWGAVGVEYAEDVAPFEMRKLRLLNAAHSWLAYAGQLAGHVYVHSAIADPVLRAGVDRLWDEAQATLPDAVQPTTAAYRAALIERFSVAEMRHELAQIGGDGSLKLRERIVPLLSSENAAPQATEAVAAWVAFVHRRVELGEPILDPNAAIIVKVIEEASDVSASCAALAELIGASGMSDEWLRTLADQVDDYLSGATV